jgi:hypothetical protein
MGCRVSRTRSASDLGSTWCQDDRHGQGPHRSGNCYCARLCTHGTARRRPRPQFGPRLLRGPQANHQCRCPRACRWLLQWPATDEDASRANAVRASSVGSWQVGIRSDQAARNREFWPSPLGLAASAALVIGGAALLWSECPQPLSWLPWLVILACPLMHAYTHRRHALYAAVTVGGDWPSGSHRH